MTSVVRAEYAGPQKMQGGGHRPVMNALSQRAAKSDAQADIGESDDGAHHEDVPADRPLGN